MDHPKRFSSWSAFVVEDVLFFYCDASEIRKRMIVLVEVLRDQCSCGLVYVGAVLIKSLFKSVFCFTDVLCLGAFGAEKHVDEV